MAKIFLLTFILFMCKIVPEIRDRYSLYRELLEQSKEITVNVIKIVDFKINHQSTLISSNTHVKHINLSDEITFIVEVKKDNYKSFKFKLKCLTLSGTPFFRYDSDGVAERIYDENTGLLNQQILTPHFNCFNEKGRGIAYHTSALKDEQQRKTFEDINVCVGHFCDESKSWAKDNGFPHISIRPGEIEFLEIKDDPNEGVQFT